MIYRQILCHISKETAVHPVLCFDPDPVDRKGISVVIQRKLWIHRHKTASFRAFLLFPLFSCCHVIDGDLGWIDLFSPEVSMDICRVFPEFFPGKGLLLHSRVSLVRRVISYCG